MPIPSQILQAPTCSIPLWQADRFYPGLRLSCSSLTRDRTPRSILDAVVLQTKMRCTRQPMDWSVHWAWIPAATCGSRVASGSFACFTRISSPVLELTISFLPQNNPSASLTPFTDGCYFSATLLTWADRAEGARIGKFQPASDNSRVTRRQYPARIWSTV